MQSKILFIMHVPPPVHGASMVGKYIHESSIINNEFETDYINLSTSVSLKEGGKAGVGKLIKLLKIQSSIISALFKKNYDLCYVTLTASGPGFYKDLVVVSLLKLFGKKIIYHFHNKGVDSVNNSGINNFLYRFAFNNTFSILISKYLYSDVINYAVRPNVFYCAYGIPESRFVINEHIAANDDKAPCRLLFLSNMMAQKGVYVLLEACKILKEKAVPFECHFVGGWSDVTPEDFQATVTSYGLGDSVFGHGPKYDQEKLKFFDDSDIFVFPTFYHYETFGLVNLEAMQHHLPVISCPEGGIPDIVVEGETGFLVPQKNPEALAEKIKVLVEDPKLRERMGVAGKKRFEELFRLETFENNMKDILRTAISATPAI